MTTNNDQQQQQHYSPQTPTWRTYPQQQSSNSMNEAVSTVSHHHTPIRYVDERTKAAGRKAELEALRRLNQLTARKAAFSNTAISPTSTNFSSFFQQQKQRRLAAKQLRLGAMTQLQQFRLDANAIQMINKKAPRQPQTPTGPSAYSRMAQVDFFGSPEWRQRKQEALRRLQAYRQQVDVATNTTTMATGESTNLQDTEHLPLEETAILVENNSDSQSHNQEQEEEEDPTVTHLDSLLLVHSELKGFFTTDDNDSMDHPTNQEQEDNLVVDNNYHAEATIHTPSCKDVSNNSNHHYEFNDEKKEEMTMDNEEQDGTSFLESAQDMIAQCEALLAATSHTEEEEPAAKSDDDGSIELTTNKSHGSNHDTPKERSSPSGYDCVASSTIEDHMNSIMAMQASLSFSRHTPSTGSPCISRADTASTNALDNTTNGHLIMTPQTFASPQQQPPPTTEEDQQEEEPPPVAGTFCPHDDDASGISSIGSSMEQTTVPRGAATTLSRASSASSLSSFWHLDDPPEDTKSTATGDTNSHKKKKDKYSQLICNSEQYLPNLHSTKGACERCFAMASTAEKAKFRKNGRHVRIMVIRGGCHRDCTAYPRTPDEPPVRLCRKCYFDCHRAPKKKR